MNATQLKDLSLLWNVSLPQAFNSVVIHELYTDTRKIVSGKNGLFAALKGPNFNGQRFIDKAYVQGVRIFLCDEPVELPADCLVIRVPHTLQAIQQWASWNRSITHIPIIGITGSNGKTTTKELINAVLSKKYKNIYRTIL